MKAIPNILSMLRILIAPVLVYLAWCGHRNAFLALLITALLTDALDGYIARKFNAESAAGAVLDSIGDLAIYLILPLCAWWLWPEIIKKEAAYVLIALIAYLVPLAAGLIKFHSIPAYHTYGAKAAAIIMCSAMLVLFMTEFSMLFRIAAIFQALVATEEIAITLTLPKLRNDVKTFWHLRKKHDGP